MTKKTKVITEIAALEAGLEAVLKELRGLMKQAKAKRTTIPAKPRSNLKAKCLRRIIP
jgi:predicted RNA binding protein YcfA (HicA-like mRNA interferase family)